MYLIVKINAKNSLIQKENSVKACIILVEYFKAVNIIGVLMGLIMIYAIVKIIVNDFTNELLSLGS